MKTGAREHDPEGPAHDHLAKPAAPLLPGPARILALQRSAGNRAVASLLARSPGAGDDSTEDLHAAVYGDSALAHAPGPVEPLRTVLGGATFDWSAVQAASVQVVRDWLTFFSFREPFNTYFIAPGECELNMERTTTSAVANQFMRETRLARVVFDQAIVADAITARLNAYLVWHDRRMHTHTPITGPVEPGVSDPSDRGPASATAPPLVLPPDPGGADTPPAGRHWEFSITVQGNFTRHTYSGPDPLATQLSGTATLKLHEEGAAGIEVSIQGGVTFVLQGFGSAARISDMVITEAPHAFGVSNAQIAAQAAWVAPLFHNTLQLSAFAQLVAGVNWSQVPPETPTALPPDRRVLMPPTPPSPAGQLAAGVQAAWALPGSGGNLLLFVQAQASGTASPGGSGGDVQASFGIQGAIPGS